MKSIDREMTFFNEWLRRFFLLGCSLQKKSGRNRIEDRGNYVEHKSKNTYYNKLRSVIVASGRNQCWGKPCTAHPPVGLTRVNPA